MSRWAGGGDRRRAQDISLRLRPMPSVGWGSWGGAATPSHHLGRLGTAVRFPLLSAFGMTLYCVVLWTIMQPLWRQDPRRRLRTPVEEIASETCDARPLSRTIIALWPVL